MIRVFELIKVGHVRRYHATHHAVCHFDDRDVDIELATDRSHFEADISCTDDYQTSPPFAKDA